MFIHRSSKLAMVHWKIESHFRATKGSRTGVVIGSGPTEVDVVRYFVSNEGAGAGAKLSSSCHKSNARTISLSSAQQPLASYGRNFLKWVFYNEEVSITTGGPSGGGGRCSRD
ncbi:hypothetical protein Tco_1015112 [Tanacetum coccineum]|uniref:Uncharacterized protein n=1 Tax=Tanacetum coccineum TaxID=301880 RepID=A0ABQ5FJY5_9ASTR